MEEALQNAAEFTGPAVVHCLTQKGKGYAPAEQDHIKNMHDAKPGLPIGGANEGSYTAAFSETLVKLGDQYPELVAITAAMPDSTGLLPFRERFPDRCIDVGIAEQHAVTAAAGMAMGGLRPLVAVYSTFLTRAIDQVNLDVGLHGLPVIFCLDRWYHRPRRCESSRCARSRAPHEGPGHDGVRPVELPGTPADARGRHGHHDRPGCDPLVARSGRPRRARRRRLRAVRSQDPSRRRPPHCSASARCFPQPRRQRDPRHRRHRRHRLRPAGRASARSRHDRRHRRSRLCRLGRGRAPHGRRRCRGRERSANAAPRAESECSACPPNTSRTTTPTSFTPGSDSTARASPPACALCSDRSRPAGGRTQV